MKAAIYTGTRQIELQDVPRTPPATGYLQIDTRCAGVCGSDLHNYYGEWAPTQGLAAGHELCGFVARVGEGVTEFEIGEFVTAECFSHCGDCLYCRKGLYNHCLNRRWFAHQSHGGFAEFTTAHVRSVFRLPADFTFEQGALVEPLAVAHRALAQSAATYQDRVAVIGGGTIGQLCLAVARAIGVRETLITVKYDQQEALARELGAHHVVNINGSDVKDYVRELTDDLGMDAVIETVGGGGNFDDALGIVRNQGALVLVAGYFEPLTVDLRRIVWAEPRITGSNCYGFSGFRTDFEAAADLIASGRIEATRLVTHRYPFDDIREAFRVASDKTTGAIKVHLMQEG